MYKIRVNVRFCLVPFIVLVLYLTLKTMPPKKDGKKPGRGGRNKSHVEEPSETNAPATEREIILKEEYVDFVYESVLAVTDVLNLLALPA